VIGLFKQKTPANIIFVFVLGILLKLPIFRHPVMPVTGKNETVLFQEIIKLINSLGNQRALIASILAYLIIFTQSMQLNKLINDHRMMQRVTFLPATSFIIITSLLPEWNILSAPMIVSSLVLFVFSGLFKIYNLYNIKGNIFNIGLGIGLSSFIFFPSVILFGWLLFALMVMRAVKINEWLICLLGVTSPFYFYSAWLLVNNSWSWDKLFTPISLSIPSPEQSLWLAVSSFLLILPFLIGGYFVQENLRKMLIQVRKNWSLMLIYLLFALFIPFLNNQSSGFVNWILIVVPFAGFHACTYLYPPQRWVPVVIFWLSVLFILAYQYYGPGWL